MALFTRFLADHNIVFLNGYGRITGRSFLHCVEQYAGHPAFNSDTDVLIELEENATAAAGFAEEVEHVSKLMAPLRQDASFFVAIVTTAPEQDRIVEVIDERISTNCEIAQFDDLAAAMAWIKIKRKGHRQEQVLQEQVLRRALSPRAMSLPTPSATAASFFLAS